MTRADKFTWQPGDIVVTLCPVCVELTDRMLNASSAEEVEENERAYAEHVATHDVPRTNKDFNEFKRFFTETA